MANKRISRHRLLIDHQVKGNLQGLLERGVQESPDREEEFDPSLEVAIGYAGSINLLLNWHGLRGRLRGKDREGWVAGCAGSEG